MAEAQQWQGKTSGGKFGQRFLLSFLKRFKVTALYPVLLLIIPFCLLFARKPNRALYHYFHNIHGYGWWKSLCATARTAHTFGKVVIDKFAIWAGRSDQFHIDLQKPELTQQLLNQEKGVLIAGSHIGNFELLGPTLQHNQKRVNVVIYGGEAETLKHQRDSVFSQNDVNLVPVTQDMSHLFTIKNALDNGEVVAILCDRLFGSPKKKTVNLLGHPADFPIGPFRLAAQMDIPVLSVFMIKGKKRNYTGFVTPLHTDESMTTPQKVDALVEQYVQSIEDILKEYPCQWFNLYEFWQHEIS